MDTVWKRRLMGVLVTLCMAAGLIAGMHADVKAAGNVASVRLRYYT